MADLAAVQPVDAIGDLHAVRTAALHSKAMLESQACCSRLAAWTVRQRFAWCLHVPANSFDHIHPLGLACLCPTTLQLPVLVPLLLRALRAPRLGTTRAAILAFRDLFLGLGDAVCDHVADDSSPTSCSLLALLQKSTGGGLNNRKIAADANLCLMCVLARAELPGSLAAWQPGILLTTS
jgi:hypothetical protein